MVFYRKYRPQSLDQLFGQEAVKQALLKASQNQQLSHAYLFCGPKGTGKTSTARILAKIVNCEVEDVTKRPCNTCSTCLSITDGSNLDFIEIDAASNRGIDDIRSLRENIKLAPSSARKKVYVIDEVHMLTTEAFNALLKTLEEPPAHVLFILATTEAHKIPATILSRVQKLDFQQANLKQLQQAIENIINQEKIELEDGVASLIARRADGSFRDAAKILDQLSAKGGKIEIKDVEELIQTGSKEDALALLSALAQKDAQKGLEVITSQLEKGVNLKEFTHDLLNNLRQIMLSHHQQSVPEELKTLSTQLSSLQVVRLINLLHQALEQMKTASIASLPLEVAVVEACQIDQIKSESQQNSVSVESDKLVNRNTDIPISSGSTDTPVLSEKTKEKLEEAKIDAEIPEIKNTTTSEDLNKLLDRWTYILETVKPYNYSLEALLRQVKVVSCEDGRVILEVPYSFHQRILEAPKSRDLLESVISDVLAKEARVSCILGARPVRVEEIANVEIAEDDEVIKIAAEIFNSEPIN
jgi:DNA polymerase III subunit gamma/tau